MQQLESVAGRKILTTKKGKPDGRTTRKPTEKQLEARKKFIENNKARAAKRKADKEQQSKNIAKTQVKETIEELKSEKLKNEQMKKDLLAQIEQEKLKKNEENNKLKNDNFFN
jgi:hypothetical protein